MVIGSLLALPIVMFYLAQYSAVRMGAMYTGNSVFGGALDTFTAETTFLLQGGLAVIEMDETVNMFSYMRWIVTLPIRDFIKGPLRSEEHTSELQSLMRISYAVF